MCLKSFQTNPALHVKHSLSPTEWAETSESSNLVSYNSSTSIYDHWRLLDTFDPSYLSFILSKLHIWKSFYVVKCSLATLIVLLIRFIWKTHQFNQKFCSYLYEWPNLDCVLHFLLFTILYLSLVFFYLFINL